MATYRWASSGVLKLLDLLGERAFVRLAQLRQEVERAAEEDDVAADRVAAGEAGDGLRGDGLEDRGGEVGVRGALVEQRLQVGLREDAAAGGDRVEVRVRGRQGVEARGVGVQQVGHLVDEGARTAGARAVHPLLDDRVEERDLGVLAAELDDHVGLRLEALDRGRTGDHFLYELDAHQVGDAEAGRAGDSAAEGVVGVLGGDLVEQRAQGATGVGVVAPVRAVAERGPLEDDRFDRGRSHIETEREFGGHGVLRSERTFCYLRNRNRGPPGTTPSPEGCASALRTLTRLVGTSRGG